MVLSAITSAEEWTRIQDKTFTRWMNAKLKLLSDLSPIKDLRTDLANGVLLTHIVSYLSPYSIDPIYKNPKHRIQKMENLNLVFDFMKYNEIHLYNIGSEDILEGNYKLILGLIWTLILHFSSLKNNLSINSNSGDSSTKTNLLNWCQKVTQGYRNVNVTDFSKSWNNGMALCAMIHHFHPELINFKKLKPENKLLNLTLALEIASRKLHIPHLIDVEDLIADHPDEKSITAYLFEWHNKFIDFKIDERKAQQLQEADDDVGESSIEAETSKIADSMESSKAELSKGSGTNSEHFNSSKVTAEIDDAAGSELVTSTFITAESSNISGNSHTGDTSKNTDVETKITSNILGDLAGDFAGGASSAGGAVNDVPRGSVAAATDEKSGSDDVANDLSSKSATAQDFTASELGNPSVGKAAVSQNNLEHTSSVVQNPLEKKAAGPEDAILLENSHNNGVSASNGLDNEPTNASSTLNISRETPRDLSGDSKNSIDESSIVKPTEISTDYLKHSKSSTVQHNNPLDHLETTESDTLEAETEADNVDDYITGIKRTKLTKLEPGKSTPQIIVSPTDPNIPTNQLQESEDEEYQEELLEWCNDIIEDQGIAKVSDFGSSFESGIALCAIVNECLSANIPISQLEASNSEKNVRLAADAVEKLLEIKLASLDPKKIVEEVKEFHESRQDLGRLEQFVNISEETVQLEREYEERAAKLIFAIDDKLSSWGTLNSINHCKDYDQVTEERRQLTLYRLTLKRDWLKEKSELNILLGNIKTKLMTYNLHPYHPPGDLSPKFIDCLWLSLTDIEKELFRRINLIAKRIQDELCQEFSTRAEMINEVLMSCEEELSQLGGTLEQQLTNLTELLETLKPLDDLLLKLQEIDIACREAEIVHNDYTPISYDDLHYEYVLLKENLVEKLSFIESQNNVKESITTRRMTPKQVEEFETIFKRVCSKNGRRALSLDEFESTLQLLDLDLEEQEMRDLFEFGRRKGSSTGGLYLNGFIKIMTELVGEEDVNADGLILAFKKISLGKPFLTDDDLTRAKMDTKLILKIRLTFPKYQAASKSRSSSVALLSTDDVDDVDSETDLRINTSYDFVQFVSEFAGLAFSGEGETVDGASILSHSSDMNNEHIVRK